MVRVIPVHNFSGQNVTAIEEPTASCTAKYCNQEMLLLALSSHCVEVHELTPQPRVTTVFPTVDLVNQMFHCNKENYIATVESKYSRDGTSVNNFVRIYVNWAIGGNQNQAMRARIAGRVTPSSNRLSNSLEMIELPLNGQPTRIACCQVTGNLLVATGDTAILHELKVERQALSKRKFIDFEARPWSLGFNFSPTNMEIAEDFFLIMDKQHFMIFRLMNQLYEDIDLLSSSNSAASSAINKSSGSTGLSLRSGTQGKRANESPSRGEHFKDNRNLEFDSLNSVDNETQRHAHSNVSSGTWNSGISVYDITNPPSCIDWDQLVLESNEDQWLQPHGTTNEKNFSCVELPALKSETHKPGPISNPFVSSAPDLEVVIKTSSPTDGWSENYVVQRLLQLKISDENTSYQKIEASEYFTCSLLKPVYLKTENAAAAGKKGTLRSDKYKNFNGIACVVCTAQEGYLFYFPAASCKNFHPLCTSYPFTAPVTHVALEDTVLHALTEAGLESYTLRLAYNTPNSGDVLQNPNSDVEPVSLIGLRPFMGVQRLLHVNRYILLLTQADSHWTLYTLSLPGPEDLYQDILCAALNHKTSSPSTYRHLLSESYAVASLSKDIDRSVLGERYPVHLDAEEPDQQLELLYRKSCLLLAEYYVNSESPMEWQLCVPYFKISQTKIAEVLAQRSISTAPGIATYLTDALLNLKSGPEADALFQVYNIVEMISTTNKKNLIQLVFGSSVLREYATEKLISIFLSLEQDDLTKFALVLLYVQAGRQDQAEKIINPIADSCILTMSLKYWQCFFDVTHERHNAHIIATFSDLSVVLMRRKSAIFADVLVKIIDAHAVSLHQILQIFLAHLPSRVGRDGHVAASVLQLFVETYLRKYFDFSRTKTSNSSRIDLHYDYSIIEAFKILVRSYLGKLTQTNVYNIEENRNDLDVCDDEEYLFENLRPPFLDKITSTTLDDKNSAKLKSKPRDKCVRNEILKLQALLASGYLPDECLQEIEEFLKVHRIDGDLSFRLLCVDNSEGTTMLMESCPQALFQYAKVMEK